MWTLRSDSNIAGGAGALTAIGLVNGNPSFLTHTQLTSLKRSLKNLSQMIMSTTSTAVQNLVEIHSWGASGQIGKIDIQNVFH